MTTLLNTINHLVTDENFIAMTESEQIIKLEQMINNYKQQIHIHVFDSFRLLEQIEQVEQNNQIEQLHEELIKTMCNFEDIFEQLNKMDADTISALIKYDETAECSDFKLVNNACNQNLTNTVIWLIEKGFSHYSTDVTQQFALSGNFELMNYYLNKKFKFNDYCMRKLIEQDHKYLIKWFCENNLLDPNCIDYKYLLHHAVKHNRVWTLEYLKSKGLEFYKNVYDYDLDFQFISNKISNETLIWLWSNGYKWTENQAKKFNNEFMMSFYL